MITIEDLKKAIKEKKITRWTPEECAVCDYPIHYLIRSFDDILFDGGCNCSDVESLRTKYVKSSLQEILDHILRLKDEELIKALKFWTI